VEIGINGLDNLDIICEGIGNFLNDGIKGVYGNDVASVISCTQGQSGDGRNLVGNDNIFMPAAGGVGIVEEVLDYEKPVLITVVTTFDSYRTAPRQFGYIDFLEQLIVSDRAQEDLPQYIQNAVGGLRFIDGVHVRLVFTPKKPILIVGFGEDSPTPSPSRDSVTLDLVGNDSTAEEGMRSPSASASGVMGVHYLWSFVVCSVIGGIIATL